jgi:tRNA(fMet)-specific endonuclease VapC
MSLYVLDTDVVVLFQEGHRRVCSAVLARPLDQLSISVITVEEQLSGWYTLLRRAKGQAQLARTYQRLADNVSMLADFRLLSFTEPAIARFESLKSLKLGIRHMDLRIAAIALENEAILVTRNARDFRSIPSLTIEDWAD